MLTSKESRAVTAREISNAQQSEPKRAGLKTYKPSVTFQCSFTTWAHGTSLAGNQLSIYSMTQCL